MTDLIAELDRAQCVLRKRPEVVASLELHEDVQLWGWIGAARVTVDQFDRYRPDPNGRPSYITPVRAWSDPLMSSWDVIRFGDLVDLVCWHPRHPFRWALRTGNGLTLGHSEWGTAPIILPNPHRWLISGGRGLCLLQQVSIGLAA